MLPDLLEILARTALIVATVIALTRLNGLRSFSKMSSFDFAMTVACGSVIASTVMTPAKPVLLGMAALAALFAVQAVIALLRTHTGWAERLVDNQPLLLVKNGRILSHNLRRARMTRDDVMNKLREAGVFDMNRVHAVVLERTGNVSVLHGQGDPGERVSPEILRDVAE